MNKDIFLCHASEDKAAVVRPLAYALDLEGVSYWLDEAEIRLGDSITERVNHGLKSSHYVVVVLSRAFLSKNWPKRELWAVLNIEARTGEVKVLPILVGSPQDVEYFLYEFPLLNDKLYIHWDGAPQSVARQIRLLVSDVPVAPDGPELLICGQCRTPFERGVYVCLGCKGNIVYGETAAERFDTWKACTMGAAVLYMAIVILTPYLVRTYLGIPTPDFWGFPALPALGIGAAFSAVTGSFLSWRSAKANSQLVRTFR